MIKCKTCGVEADEILNGIPYCQKHFNKIVKQRWVCPVCGEIFRVYDDNGAHIDGSFATMHDECYIRTTENPDIEWKCIGGRVDD